MELALCILSGLITGNIAFTAYLWSQIARLRHRQTTANMEFDLICKTLQNLNDFNRIMANQDLQLLGLIVKLKQEMGTEETQQFDVN